MYPPEKKALEMTKYNVANLTPVPGGNQLATKHASYSLVKLGDRAHALADEIRPLVPAYDVCDEIGLRVLCLALARLERAAASAGHLPRRRPAFPLGAGRPSKRSQA
jgi:hypothetical protein